MGEIKMNSEIIKAMNKKKKIHSIHNWWFKNGYKVLRIVFFPIWVILIIHEKIINWLNSRQSWNEERAKKILDYYIPRKSDWDNEEKTFYFFDNGLGWGNIAKQYLKRKDYRFWNINHYKIRSYLIQDFQLEGFIKEKGDCYDGRTELIFKMIEN